MDSPALPGRSIRNYFTPNISLPEHAPVELDGARGPPVKKIKITADNGRDIALRGVQDRKVKTERIEAVAGTSKSGGLARRTAGRAKLGLLPSVPLDVLFEIFGHLAPLDLLRLARTTQELRRLLLHRSSTSIWKAVLSNVEGLPACPEDMSLPGWTNLVFEHHCQECLMNIVKKCDFTLRVRYCKKCASHKLLPQSEFDPNNCLHRLMLKCIPFSNWNSNGDQYCTVADRNTFLDDIEVVLDSEDDNSIPDFTAKKYAEIDARREHAWECIAWSHNLLRSRKRELADCRKSRAESIRAKLVELGYQAELDFLDELKAGICAINPWPRIVKFEDHPLVKPAKPLTEKIWAAMKDEMIKYITEAARLRKKNIRRITLRTRTALVHTAYLDWRRKPENLSRYPADSPMPNLADVVDFPPIQSMIHPRNKVALDIEHHIIPCLARSLHDEIEEWREDIASDLLGKVTGSRLWDDAEWRWDMAGEFWDERMHFFERAVIVLRCKNRWMHYRWEEQRLRADVVFPASTQNVAWAIATAAENEAHAPVMWYPQFVHHRCTSMKVRSYDERRTGTNESLSVDKEYRQCRHAIWDAETLVFDEQASRATRNILVACCMDWKKTTTKQLDELDPRLVCLKCSFGVRCDGERKVRVWNWRDAVQHCLSAHFGDASVTWEYLCPEDAAQARQLEATECAARGFHPPASQKIWRCIKCRDTTKDTGRMSWDALAEHFRRTPSHGDAENMDNKEGTMYYRAMDVFPREGPPVKMIPQKKDPAQAWKYNPVRPRNPFLERLWRSPSP